MPETWADILEEQAKESAARQKAFEDRLEAEMSAQIKALESRPDEEVVELMLQFHGGRFHVRETQLRQKFHDACKAELLKRLAIGRPA